jgi:hypothetical protein
VIKSIVRKAFKINTWVWIILLSILLVIFYVTFSIPDASGITREEYNELEESVENAKEQIDDLVEAISDQRNIINEKSDDLENLQKELKEAETKKNESWDSIQEVMDLEDKVVQAETKYKEARQKLFSLLNEKSEQERVIDELEKILSSSKIESEKFDTSNLAKNVAVRLSQTCITALENGISSECPTYKQLVILDTSDTNISGKFTTDENGYFHRDKAPIDNSWRYYDLDDELRVFIDPPQGMAERVKTITIQSNFDTYFVQNDMTVDSKYELVDFVINGTTYQKAKTVQVYEKVGDFGRVIYHDRYVDNCKHATINAEKWEMLLADTIHYMRNNCDEAHTSYQEREIIYANSTNIDLTTSPNWNYFQWLEEVSNHCIFKFKACS